MERGMAVEDAWADIPALDRQCQRVLELFFSWSAEDPEFLEIAKNRERKFWTSYRSLRYPEAFRFLEDPPLILWASRDWGPPDIQKFLRADRTNLAVVGSRRMSAYGRQATQWLVQELVTRYQYQIVSGCAMGVDTVAHETALRSGGQTIGIWAGDIPSLPERSSFLVSHPNALVLTECSPGIMPQQWSFPQRNRLIAGLSNAVLVIEAQERSGTLITAAAALQQGKEVFVLTQPFTSPNAKGVCRLVEQGAHLVASAEDIHAILFPALKGTRSSKKSEVSEQILRLCRTPLEKSIATFLWKEGGEFLESTAFSRVQSQLAQESSTLSLAQWQEALLSLELRGVLRQNIGVLQLSCIIQSASNTK
jgi:DNA processing protein